MLGDALDDKLQGWTFTFGQKSLSSSGASRHVLLALTATVIHLVFSYFISIQTFERGTGLINAMIQKFRNYIYIDYNETQRVPCPATISTTNPFVSQCLQGR